MSGRVGKIAAWAAILIFALGTAAFAYAGTYSRFWADDYCYSAVVKHVGLFQGLAEWYQSNGNRVSTVVVVAVADLFGPNAIRFSPLVVLAAWTGAWIFFLFQLRRLLGWTAGRYWLALLAVVEVYFAALLAPDRLQTIYWRMGTYHYTLPMALLLINLGLLTRTWCWEPGNAREEGRSLSGADIDGSSSRCASTGKSGSLASVESPFTSRTAWTWGAAALLGFFAAGLSETFAAMQTGGLALAIVAVLFFAPRAERGRRGAGLAAALAGSLLMMLVMALAPANAWRQDVMPPPDNLLLILPTSLRFAADFILYSVRGQITPFLVYAALLGTLGLLGIPTGEVKVSPRAGLVGAFGSLGVMYALIVCSFAPSAYAALSYPAGRALMPGSFILLAGLGCAALLLGLTLRSLVPAGRQGWLAAGALALLLLLSLYPLRALAVVRQDIGRLAVRAERWDARNTQIRQALAAGNQDLTVPQVDVVQGLEDIGPDSTQWVNNCASAFYGARSITAKP